MANTKENKETVKEEKKLEPTVEGLVPNPGTFSTEILSAMRKKRTRKGTVDEAYKFLQKARTLRWLLTGTLLSVEDFDNEEINAESELAVRVQFEEKSYKTEEHWGRVNVLIPEAWFFEKDVVFAAHYDPLNDFEKKKIRRSILSQYIGAWIHFNVVAVMKNEQNGDIQREALTCVGNRVSAMDHMKDIYFLHKRDENKKKFVTLETGTIVDSFVQRVSDDYIVVSSLGVETKVQKHDLTNSYITKCQDVVKNGDQLNLRIRRIKVTEDKIYLNLTNRKIYDTSHLEWLKTGLLIGGEVVAPVNQKGFYTIILDNDLYCAVREGDIDGYLPMIVGDRVIVEVFDVKDKLVYGKARRGF